MQRRWPNILAASWPFLVLGGLVLLFFGDILFGGRAFFLRDTYCDYQPMREYTAAAFRAGHMPLWNSHSYLGQPYMAQPQTGVFYPSHLLYLVFSPVAALKATWFLHFLLAAFAMYALARRWGLDRWPAVLTAELYTFSTAFIAHLEFMSTLELLAWAPLAVIAASDAVDILRRARGIVPRLGGPLLAPFLRVVVCLTLLFLAGYQQFMAFFLLVIGLYLLTVVGSTRDAALLPRGVLFFALTGMFVAGLVAVQLLATVELVPYSYRAAGIDPGFDAGSMHPLHLLRLLFPFLAGGPGYPGTYWGGSLFEFWVGVPHFGVIVWFLLLFAPAACRTSTACSHGPCVPTGCSRRTRSAELGRQFRARPGRDTLHERACDVSQPTIPEAGSPTGSLSGSQEWTGEAATPDKRPAGGTPTDERLRFALRACVAIALVTGVLAMGKYMPGVPAFYRAVPLFRWPAKILILMGFALPFLFGAGLQTLVRLETLAPDVRRRLLRRVWIGALAVTAAVLVLIAGTTLRPDAVRFLSPSSARLQPGQVAAILADLRLGAVLMLLSLGLLALLVRGSVRPGVRGAAVTACAAANLFLVGYSLQPRVPDSVYAYRSPQVSELRGLTADGSRVQSMYTAAQQWLYVQRDPALICWARDAMAGETALPAQILRTTGGGELLLGEPIALVSQMASLPSGPQSRVADLFSLRWLVTGQPLFDILWHGASRQFEVTERPSAFPRAWCVDQLHRADTAGAAVAQLLAPEFDPRRAATVQATAAEFADLAAAVAGDPRAAGPPGRLRAVRFDWNRIDLETEVGRPCLLVVNEAWFPGWRADVDGKEMPVFRADGIFQGVPLPAGARHVSLVFAPASFVRGLIVSGITFACLIGLAGVAYLRGRR